MCHLVRSAYHLCAVIPYNGYYVYRFCYLCSWTVENFHCSKYIVPCLCLRFYLILHAFPLIVLLVRVSPFTFLRSWKVTEQWTGGDMYMWWDAITHHHSKQMMTQPHSLAICSHTFCRLGDPPMCSFCSRNSICLLVVCVIRKGRSAPAKILWIRNLYINRGTFRGPVEARHMYVDDNVGSNRVPVRRPSCLFAKFSRRKCRSLYLICVCCSNFT